MASLSLPVERKLFNPLWWREILFRWQSQSLKTSSVSDVDAGIPVSKVVEVHQAKAPTKASSADDYMKVPNDGVTITVTELESEDDLDVEEDRAVTIISEPETDSDKLASDILDVIGGYGLHTQPKDADGPVTGWTGKSFFMDRVKTQVAKGHAIEMILPAFPWKSINQVDKVTGVLPDLGEELALSRLHQLCEDIKAVYPPGGQVHIATDGLLFDDVVGISDENTWAYGDGLVQMAKSKGYDKSIKLFRVMDILGYTADTPLNKESYLSLAQKCRNEILEKYGRTEEEVREMMRDDPDTLLTYCGFIRFLETDLRHSPVAANATSGQKYRKIVKKVAINMMIRAESFTKFLQAMKPKHVRLSIHPSSGTVKLSIPLIVQGSGGFPKSPWHSSIAIALDGTYTTVHSKAVRDTHRLMYKDGRPYFYREKSELWDWEDEDVAFEAQYPNIMLIYPRADIEKSLTEAQLEKVQQLREVHRGPVKVIGFENAAAA
ncbi:isocyanide synthase family protein [Aspergillus glaucus CBS 516.65]|uniref:TauD/TfdA-like domain-containing protein n=1 Tax=Aspergillus glaucus CBS 516.65 TaxID=1160497 RepID=A0A1L9VF31_ASPGL|nr:hypothetical protein ASPGLDRAFT_49325 [Aspergillus glaucus CBS 516.65]OJJ82520.1 hypothetical protein ASPGLDRAFT_49325 [Aspergillus glaucus CBS 516.65]